MEVVTQEFCGASVNVKESIAELRNVCRAYCGLAFPCEGEPDTLELNVVFALSYALYNGPRTTWQDRWHKADRCKRDVNDYMSGKGLPYYVLHFMHRLKTEPAMDLILRMEISWGILATACQAASVEVPAYSPEAHQIRGVTSLS